MTGAKLRKLIPFIIDQVRDASGSLPKTKLVKLLYLADLNAVRQLGRRITEVDWIYWHYGPYSTQVDDALRDVLGRSVNELEVITRDGRRVLTYETVAPQAIEQEFSLEERLVVYDTLKSWAGEELRDVLNYVYFETEPMAGARWGERLDFSRVRRVEAESQWDVDKVFSQVPPDRLARFRQQLKERVRQAKGQQPTPPTYDPIFFEAIKTADEEDRRGAGGIVGSSGTIPPESTGRK